VQPERRDRLLRGIELALLLVVIEETRHRVQVFRIRIQGRPRLIKKLARALGLREQIEITLDHFRRPQRLETLFVHGQPLLDGTSPVLDHGFSFYRKDLVSRKLLVIVRDQLLRGGVVFLRYQKFQKAGVKRLLLRIARQPGAILCR
jgi:hypothetical protein